MRSEVEIGEDSGELDHYVPGQSFYKPAQLQDSDLSS
jgi:hypothetical protein